MDTVWTVADAYFDVCSAAGCQYGGTTMTPSEYGQLLAHAYRAVTRALARIDDAHVDLSARPLARLISEAARKSTRAILPHADEEEEAAPDCAIPRDERDRCIFMSVFRATICARAESCGLANGARAAMLISDLVEAAIARRQLSYITLPKGAAASAAPVSA